MMPGKNEWIKEISLVEPPGDASELVFVITVDQPGR
jgi:hypothetical protein